MPRIRVVPAMIALILTFAVLFGGLQVYRHYELTQPLQQQLRAIPSITSVSVDLSAATPIVSVHLGPNADLENTFTRMETVISNALGTQVTIRLNDRRSTVLRNDYSTIFRPIIFTGIAQGNFVSMFAAFKKAANVNELHGKITMNSRDLFIELTQGQSYLYDVVPFSIRASGVTG